MNARTVIRRWVSLLVDEPPFPDGVAAFRSLADADARRAELVPTDSFLRPTKCECKGIAHALTLRDRMSVTSELQVAKDRGQRDLVTYLSARLENCMTVNPTAEQIAARAAADLRAARRELNR